VLPEAWTGKGVVVVVTTMKAQIVMQEILSKPGGPNMPVEDLEFYELRIDDWTDTWQSGFAVTQWRISWSETEQQFVWSEEQSEHWPTLDCAESRYGVRLHALKERGFVHSDMDF
jgi:hypothetical protein